MSRDPQARETWQVALRSLMAALGDVVRAEATVLREDVKTWGRRFGFAMALFGIAFMTIFWLLALMLYAAVRATEQLFSLGPAQAALAVAGVCLVLILLLALIGYLLLRGVSGPLAATRRRLDDHRRWWREHILEVPASDVDD